MWRLWLALIVAAFVCGSAANLDDSLVILKAERRVDLTSQFVKNLVSLKIENTGEKPISSFLFTLSQDDADKLSFFSAGFNEAKGKQKTITGLVVEADGSQYKIELDKELRSGESTTINVYYVLTHALKPLPEEIRQSDVQLMLHRDNAHLISPYPVKSQTTIFSLPGSRIESYTKVDSTKVSGKENKEIKYGPYLDSAPFRPSPIIIHFENNSPFAVVELLEREIEISHWGNIYVTENYNIKHDGAHLKGGFSRLDFQSKPSASGVSAFRYLVAKLPPRVHSVYYRDEIGNISTSHMMTDIRKTEVLLEPRYPLFGGWKATFTLGYGVPLSDFVFTAPDGRRYLNYTFGSSIGDVVVDKLVIKVVLPEGSKDPTFSVPFPINVHFERKSSYLDTVGRTVVVLTKTNVIPEHNVVFQVYYRFTKWAMIVEPLMLIAGFFCLFLASMAYLHFDFPISKSSEAYLARLQQNEVSDNLQRLEKVMKRRLGESEKLEGMLSDVARTGDVSSCRGARKESDSLLKESSKEVKSIVESLQHIPFARTSGVLGKVEALVAKEKEKQEKLLQKINLTADLFEKKMSNKEIDVRLAPSQHQYEALKAEVNELIDALDE